MNAKKRILTLLLSAAMLTGITAIPAYAAEEVVMEESFDDYSPEYDVAQTLLPSIFTADANSIGDGYIRVIEDPTDGNLYLKSHVFSQIYTTEPIEGSYTFSMDVFQTQGNRECAIFLRAPKCGNTAYYEADGSDVGTAACRTGVVINCHGPSIDVNIKSFNSKANETAFLQQNIFTFELPDGVSIGRGTNTNLRVEDTGTEMSIYVADTQVCRIALSEPAKSGYLRAEVTEPCFRKAVLYDASGAEMATIENPTIQCQGSTIGWATRVADMIVDNVYLAVDQSATADTDAPTTPGTDAPTEPETKVETNATTPDAGEDTAAPGTNGSTDDATDGATNAPTDNEIEEPAVKNDGCSGTLGMGAAAVMAATAAAVALRKKQ